MQKRKVWFICAPLLVVLALGVFFFQEKEKKSIQIGVLLYLENDTFVEKIVAAMEEEALAFEKETGLNVVLNISGAGGSQRTQNEQVKRYVQLGYDAICVNLVDRTSAAAIIDQTTAEGREIPVVFFNREPVREDMMRREKVYYVGADAKQGAVLQGEMVLECYRNYPERLDKNGDGILQYVMLEGEMGHQDTIMRSDYPLQTITESGVQLQKLASGTADWSRERAVVLTEQWVQTFGDKIELVLCNNDDMALGAIQAMERDGFSAAVFGIDATEVGLEALDGGSLWGTVDCNATEQGRAAFRLAATLAAENRLPEDYPLTQERYYRATMTKRLRAFEE